MEVNFRPEMHASFKSLPKRPSFWYLQAKEHVLTECQPRPRQAVEGPQVVQEEAVEEVTGVGVVAGVAGDPLDFGRPT